MSVYPEYQQSINTKSASPLNGGTPTDIEGPFYKPGAKAQPGESSEADGCFEYIAAVAQEGVDTCKELP